MSLRHGVPSPLVSILALALADGGSALEASDAPDVLTAATPLRASRSVQSGTGTGLAWTGSPVCDDEGNVFIVVMPPVDPRDRKHPPALARYTKKPYILRVSADGKKTGVIKLDAIPAFANADTIEPFGLAVDPSGSLHALVLVLREENDKEYRYKSGKQYIVSFDSKSQYSSHLEVDQDEMVVRRFEALGSGDFLVDGMRPGYRPRVAIMGAGGGSFSDVTVLENNKDETPLGAVENKDQTSSPVALPGLPAHTARGGDGRVYFVARGQESVYVIEPSGQSRLAFKLARMPRSCELFGLEAAGNRVVAVYREEQPKRGAGFWMAVYNAVFGERVAVYGPADAVPLCYKCTDGQDQFTLLKANAIVTMSP
jgi:hypothetical protein